MRGLHGAVTATLVANGIVVLALWYALKRHGYPLDRTTFYVTLLPATLLAGPWTALVCVAVATLVNADARAWCREAIDRVGMVSWLKGQVADRLAG